MFGIALQLRSTKVFFYNSEVPTLGHGIIYGMIRMPLGTNKMFATGVLTTQQPLHNNSYTNTNFDLNKKVIFYL